MSCKACNLVYFCDEDCKSKSWKQHQILCKSVITLQKQQRDKVMRAGTYSSVLSVKDEAKVASLVGENCLTDCQLNGQVTSLLLDTAAQVPIVDIEDLKNYYSNTVVRSLDEILYDCDSFRVQWRNTADIPFTGSVDMIVTIGEENNCGSVHVPFVVTTEKLQQPILSFNAIKVIMDAQKNTEALVKMFSMLFNSSNTDNVKQFVHLIQEPSDDKQALARVREKNLIIPAGRIMQVPCKADVGFVKVKKAMLFQPGEIDVPEGLQYAETVVLLKSSTNNYFKMPVVNDCRKDVILHKNTQLGYLEPIKSIAPLNIEERVQPVVNTIISSEADKPVDKQNFKHKETTDHTEINNNLTLTEKQLSIISNIDLAGLTHSQKEQVRQLMREEISVFSLNDQDIGCVKTPQMKINLKVQVPVQQNYNSIPKQLYDEMKHYIEDLLNKQ